MNRILPIAIAATLSAISAHAVYAAPVVSGFILGPDDGTSINMRIVNDASSTVNIKSIQLNGNTAISFPLIWDGVGPSSGPDQFGQLVFLDEDTRVLTIEFITAFNPGESFNSGPDGCRWRSDAGDRSGQPSAGRAGVVHVQRRHDRTLQIRSQSQSDRGRRGAGSSSCPSNTRTPCRSRRLSPSSAPALRRSASPGASARRTLRGRVDVLQLRSLTCTCPFHQT